MKYAAAMKYGGELVEAKDCDYDSFKELVPLCPNCKEPVFLRIGGDRTSPKGKAYQIGPHWCHFKGVSVEQAAGCELRVNNYSEKDRAKIAAQAKGQRLKLLQRWFWEVFRSNHAKSFELGIEDSIEKVNKSKNTDIPKWFSKIIKSEQEYNSKLRKFVFEELNEIFKAIENQNLLWFSMTEMEGENFTKLQLKDPSFTIKKGRAPVFPYIQESLWKDEHKRKKIVSPLNKKIATEVVNFLWSKKNIEICKNVISIGAWEVFDFADQIPGFYIPGFKIWRGKKNSENLYVEFPSPSFDEFEKRSQNPFFESKYSAEVCVNVIEDWAGLYQVSRLHMLFLIATIDWASEFQYLEEKRSN
jgi:hypothetical protein